jgi:hypothetical protein
MERNRQSTIVNLPVAAIPAPTATAGIAAAGPPAAATASRTAIATATSEVIARRTRFVHRQPTALQRLPIQAGDCPLHVLAFSQFDEPEAPRLSRHFIANDNG